MRRLRRHRALVVLLGAGLAWRLLLAFVLYPGQGYAGDLGLFWQWAQSLAANGPGHFYASTGSANYPPLSLDILWVLGAVGDPDLIKVPAILADLGIATIAYAIATRWRGGHVGLIAAGLFLFLPVSWYDSALWGQVDAVGTLLVMVAILLLVDGWSEGALLFAVLAVLVKPQYAIALGVVLPVLLRRHVLAIGSGPSPTPRGPLARLDDALGGLLRDQGPRRLVSSVSVGLLATILVALPFDLAVYAPASLADVPVLANLAGLGGLFARLSSEFTALTANAFNPWALAGSPSLAAVLGGTAGHWLPDSLPVLGSVPAVTVGATLLVAVGLLVALGLVVRDGVLPILFGFTILALAFFVLPTRVHERYLFPFFASASVLAAPWLLASAWLGVLAVLNALNLHAVLAGNLFMGMGGGQRAGGGFGGGQLGGGFGGAGFGRLGGVFRSIELPWADVARSDLVVTASAIGLTATLVLLVGAWWVVLLRPRHVARDRPAVPVRVTPG